MIFRRFSANETSIVHDNDEGPTVAELMINSIKQKVAVLKDSAQKNNDMAKRQLNYIAKLVTDESDAGNRLTSAKARLIDMRRPTLAMAIQSHKEGKGLEIRYNKQKRKDHLDLQNIIEELWHEVTEERKGKSRRCWVRRVVSKGEHERHRIHLRHGSVEDNYKKAIESQLYRNWQAERIVMRLPAEITFKRFRRKKCFCVRKAGRRFCVCPVCDGMDEFLSAFVTFYAGCHKDAEDGECKCNEPSSVRISSSSVNEFLRATTCGKAAEILLNSRLDMRYTPWNCDCMKSCCDGCKDKFPSCPLLWAEDEEHTWREYQRVPKLKKNQELNPVTGLLETGEKPRMELELVLMTGTKHQ